MLESFLVVFLQSWSIYVGKFFSGFSSKILDKRFFFCYNKVVSLQKFTFGGSAYGICESRFS